MKAQLEAIKKYCWDGAWWIRGFDDDGIPLGSHSCEHGQIWLNSQTWAVLADCGPQKLQVTAMDSVAQILDTPCGIKKLHPSFPTFPEASDAFSGYSLGAGENGAIFCHSNAWAVIAECLLHRSDRAWKYFEQLVPHLSLQRSGLARYQCEPYAYASSIIGPENPRYGLATLTHVTGTAAWMDVAATQYLLGIRPVLDGLKFAPCLPHDWPGFTATRMYRGTRLDIDVRNPGDPMARVGALFVNGQRYRGDVLEPVWIKGKETARIELEWVS
ncbi:MAG: GH36-type glycosyl hydrolase domain-containing protein [Chthoniobacteraceae bacterium]